MTSLVPSWLSLGVSVGLGLLITTAHVLFISTSSGLLLPNLLPADTELWGTVLVSWVEPAVRFLTENSLAATCTLAIFWAVVGAFLYSTVSSTVTAAKEARHAEDPTMRFYLQLLGWHVFVGAAFVGATVLFAPFVRWILYQDELLAQSATTGELIGYAASAIGSWIILFHTYVILYRLYRRFYIS